MFGEDTKLRVNCVSNCERQGGQKTKKKKHHKNQQPTLKVTVQLLNSCQNRETPGRN